MGHVPLSTYRLQLHAGFTFDDARNVAQYLKDLGITHIYASPYLQAASGSMHGYNVVDHQQVNAELGGEEGHAQFCARLRELGMGQVLDIVPNHMAAGAENKCWWDVLENGPSSRFALWFDIDWHSAEVRLQDKVLIPVLGDQYGRVLSARQIVVEQDCGLFRVRYMEHTFPVAPRSLAAPLAKAAELADNAELNFFADSFSRLPVAESQDQAGILSRHRDKEVIYGLLRTQCQEQPAVAAAIAKVVEQLNADTDALDELLNLQHYRLAYWRTADQELGYRRFFDVNALIGVRVERPEVFEATHRRILDWLGDRTIDGVRIDHPDGLRDPEQYFLRLRDHAPESWIVAEKILEPGEALRETWPIQGTTGYDFLNACNLVLVPTDGLKELGDIYSGFTGATTPFKEMARTMKLDVEREALGSDINRLTSLFVEICESNRDRRDYTRAEIRRAIREIASCFSIYRTYVAPARDRVEDQDREEIDKAILLAKQGRPDLDAELMDFIGGVLALRVRGGLETEFLLRFQQFTSPVMAKGVEDTALYCFNRLVGLNEVGGAPDRDGLSLQEFHEYCARAQWRHPYTMTTLSTHDTKRADDVRARLAVLAEMPGQWRALVKRWARRNALFKTAKLPDHNTEYLLYQTIVGAWPISEERLQAYMEKAVREAKQQTSWTQQNKEFEDALREFIHRIVNSDEFVGELEAFVGLVVGPGRINSLAQTLIKLTAPGVPDTFQGGELWDLRLVDPDNRGPVDFDAPRAMLAELKAGLDPETILARVESGLPKLWVLHQGLQLRQQRPEWFGAEAGYFPIYAEGPKEEHVIAFMRREHVVTCVARWSAKLGGKWGSTSIGLPEGRWKNALTGEEWDGGTVRVQNLLQRFPVALLTKESELTDASI